MSVSLTIAALIALPLAASTLILAINRKSISSAIALGATAFEFGLIIQGPLGLIDLFGIEMAITPLSRLFILSLLVVTGLTLAQSAGAGPPRKRWLRR